MKKTSTTLAFRTITRRSSKTLVSCQLNARCGQGIRQRRHFSERQRFGTALWIERGLLQHRVYGVNVSQMQARIASAQVIEDRLAALAADPRLRADLGWLV